MSLMLSHRPDFAGHAFPQSIAPAGCGPLYSTLVTMPDGKAKHLAVRLATCDAERDQARMLINKMYDWRGYGSSHHIPASERHSTFLATLDDQLVGTVTLAVDAPGGLAADGIFRDEINTYRRVPGASVCELTKLAFDADMPSRKLMASLFHIVFLYGRRRHHCTDLFIEVNPRHRRFYEAMLGFAPVGPLKTNTSVDAPSQLMQLRVTDIAARISQFAGREQDGASSRSLYPLFLSQADQRNVVARLSGSTLSHSLGPQPFEARA